MRKAKDFYDQIIETKLIPDTGYGSKVLPALQIYVDIEEPEERKSYQDALELMLESDDKKIRKFAVDICLGFFVFREMLK